MDSFGSILNSPLFWAFIIFLIVDAVILFIVYFSRKKAFHPADRKFFLKKWDDILKEKDFKHQVMEADKLLDKVLHKRGYQGSLGEKLKQAKKCFSNYNGVWSAHKLRNKLAHELDARVSASETQQALRQFRLALKDLGLLN